MVPSGDKVDETIDSAWKSLDIPQARTPLPSEPVWLNIRVQLRHLTLEWDLMHQLVNDLGGSPTQTVEKPASRRLGAGFSLLLNRLDLRRTEC